MNMILSYVHDMALTQCLLTILAGATDLDWAIMWRAARSARSYKRPDPHRRADRASQSSFRYIGCAVIDSMIQMCVDTPCRAIRPKGERSVLNEGDGHVCSIYSKPMRGICGNSRKT